MKKVNNLISEREQLAEEKRKKAQKLLASVNRLSSVMGKGKKFTCSKCGQERRVVIAFIDKD